MHKRFIAAAILTGALAGAAYGQVKRVGPEKSMFSSAVWVGDTVYLSGTMAPVDYQGDKAKGTLAGYKGDTKAQAIGAIKSIEATLKEQGLGLGDIVQMQAFLAGDPAKGGMMDIDGWNEAYRQFFGTAEQPNRPVRATVQVAHLVLPTGLIEIMVIAARPHGGAAQ
ncbi:MAG TPA: Rid family hydrolase [Edaphobacter sp.]|nr:Rid family hydrolase [Edaphobacter sp.]